jgi:hypothetical protein
VRERAFDCHENRLGDSYTLATLYIPRTPGQTQQRTVIIVMRGQSQIGVTLRSRRLWRLVSKPAGHHRSWLRRLTEELPISDTECASADIRPTGCLEANTSASNASRYSDTPLTNVQS